MAEVSNAAHGKDFQGDLFDALNLASLKGGIALVRKDYGLRHPGYHNAKQYYAPFVVTFRDGVQWALFTTTSCRTDRIKGQQWDADHLKTLEPAIKRVFLVYPDEVSERERAAFESQQRKYDTNWEFSRIDRILPYTELMNEIAKHG